ncbi:hypothetical protein Hdeb2414_s0002g00048121 [Helianthus debilis subsp. tardiflorus]
MGMDDLLQTDYIEEGVNMSRLIYMFGLISTQYTCRQFIAFFLSLNLILFY